jgi:hypothetical protein
MNNEKKYNLRIQGVEYGRGVIDRCVNGKIILKWTLEMGFESMEYIHLALNRVLSCNLMNT